MRIIGLRRGPKLERIPHTARIFPTRSVFDTGKRFTSPLVWAPFILDKDWKYLEADWDSFYRIECEIKRSEVDA